MSTDFDPVEAGAEALRAVGYNGKHGLYATKADARAVLAAALDRDKLAWVIHDSGPCEDADCLDPDDRGYCDKRADAIRAWAGVTP